MPTPNHFQEENSMCVPEYIFEEQNQCAPAQKITGTGDGEKDVEDSHQEHQTTVEAVAIPEKME